MKKDKQINWTSELQEEEIILKEKFGEMDNFPKHIAIIMDGNGRWATSRSLPRAMGHKQGVEAIRDIVKAASKIGVKFLTLYAFSVENWKRPSVEVNVLMNLLEQYLRQEVDELHHNKVKLGAIGDLSSLPKVAQKLLADAHEKTKDNDGLQLNLALSYSSRWDILNAVKSMANDAKDGKLIPSEIDETTFSNYLSTKAIPDPDLLIRTSGEMRLSNFLLWEMAYSEIFITDKYWPDFNSKDLYEAILNYLTRERRFGKTSAQVQDENSPNANLSFLQRVVNAIKS